MVKYRPILHRMSMVTGMIWEIIPGRFLNPMDVCSDPSTLILTRMIAIQTQLLFAPGRSPYRGLEFRCRAELSVEAASLRSRERPTARH